jgi:hypothetical protein
MLKFYCEQCKKDLDKCQCEDLEERFKERFAGSCLEKAAMAAVEEVRGNKEQKHGRGKAA